MGEKYLGQLTAKSAPATGDILVLEDSEDTKKIDYDALANAVLNKLTTKTYTVAGGSNTLIAAINALNSNIAGLVLKYKGRLEIPGSTGDSIAITSTSAHFIYIVACGSWNYSTLLAVFPANGGEPRVKVLATYSNAETPPIPVTITVNGTNGLTITNTINNTTCPLTVYAIIKTN